MCHSCQFATRPAVPRRQGSRESTFADLKPRAFTELTRVYNELRSAGRFVHRHRAEILDELPALRAAMGILGKRKGGGGGDPDPTPTGGGDSGGAEDSGSIHRRIGRTRMSRVCRCRSVVRGEDLEIL